MNCQLFPYEWKIRQIRGWPFSLPTGRYYTVVVLYRITFYLNIFKWLCIKCGNPLGEHVHVWRQSTVAWTSLFEKFMCLPELVDWLTFCERWISVTKCVVVIMTGTVKLLLHQINGEVWAVWRGNFFLLTIKSLSPPPQTDFVYIQCLINCCKFFYTCCVCCIFVCKTAGEYLYYTYPSRSCVCLN